MPPKHVNIKGVKVPFVKYDGSQQAHHGQMTSKQRYINVDSIGTTLFQRRLTMMCPLGCMVAFFRFRFSCVLHSESEYSTPCQWD